MSISYVFPWSVYVYLPLLAFHPEGPAEDMDQSLVVEVFQPPYQKKVNVYSMAVITTLVSQ